MVTFQGSACHIKAGKLEVAGLRHSKEYRVVEGLRVFMDQPELAASGKSSLVDGFQEILLRNMVAA